MKKVNEKLKKYIENQILPHYDNFDHGHDRRHADSVIERGLEFAEELNDDNINIDIVYASCAYHDIGMIKGRKGHANFSYEYVLNDEKLKEFFDEDEIKLIAEACQDHSTSTGRPPRTIYGMIVSDADKDSDINIGLMRGWDFSIFHFPNMTFEEHIDDIHKEIYKRFNINGTVKLYLPIQKIQSFLNEMRYYAYNKEAYRDKMLELLAKEDNIEK